MIEPGKAVVQVNETTGTIGIAQGGFRRSKVFRPDAQVQVSVGAQALLRVLTSDRPALNHDRIDTDRLEIRNYCLDLTLVDGSLNAMQAISLMQLKRGRGVPQVRMAKTPPA